MTQSPYAGGNPSVLAGPGSLPISPNPTPPQSFVDPNFENTSLQYLSPPATHHRRPIQLTSRSAMANHQPIPPPAQPASQEPRPSSKTVEAPETSESEQSSPERSLPSKDVTEDSFDSAYSDFILYCNPSIPADVDTEELRKGFRNPPRSDGNSFSPWTLWNLLQKMDRKEIKTWAHLVMELGVEPPDPEKNQSAQKVQQYAVRLKRWLHAYHIDSFFNYLASRPSPYYTERPRTDAELAETVREGIPPEEDLAVRALLPEWRPKRGRRKVDDGSEIETTQHSHIYEDHYSATPGTAVPWSAVPSSGSDDVWTAAQIAIAPKSASPHQSQSALSAHPNSANARTWRVSQPYSSNETPSTEAPASALTPNTTSATTEGDPKSAVPASATVGSKSPSATKRKRHTPAISSAWTQGQSGGKIRGRPPSNRNIQDGPFGTFPVNPSAKDAGTVQNVTASGISTYTRQPSPHQHSMSPPTFVATSVPGTGPSSNASNASYMVRSRSNSGTELHPANRRPSKLQLQVPPHAGGPVRLATPPRVLVNGEAQLHAAAANHERGGSAEGYAHMGEMSESEELAMLEGRREDDRDVDWRRRCYALMQKLQEKEEELKRVKRAVLDAVM